MSVVTSLMLAVPYGDAEYEGPDGRVLLRGLAHVRDWCEGRHHPDYGTPDYVRDRDLIGFPDRPVDAVSGGTKHMEVAVYAWGANYLDLDGFLGAVRAAPWRSPGRVQVFARGQDDLRFLVWSLNDDRTWDAPTPEQIARNRW